MKFLEQLESKVLLERLVIGLEEPILVKGLGELQAKIDSGNGGYNVIHGTNFHQQGDQLMFTTQDCHGNDKKLQAKVIDDIEVNMGGGNIENRPVIELDIKFAGEDYKKIPFSVTDRSTNTNPILISKGFVEKELEALIDVGTKNISKNGINVVYGESVNSFFDKVEHFGKFLAGDEKNPFVEKDEEESPKEDQKSQLEKKDEEESSFGKEDLEKSSFGKEDLEKSQKIAKSIANSQKIVEQDKKEVHSRMSNLSAPKTLAKSEDIDLDKNVIKQWSENKIDVNDLPVNLVTSYMMTKGNVEDNNEIKGLEQKRAHLKEWIKNTKEKIKSLRNQNGKVEEQEEKTEQTTNAVPSESSPQVNDKEVENVSKTPQFDKLEADLLKQAPLSENVTPSSVPSESVPASTTGEAKQTTNVVPSQPTTPPSTPTEEKVTPSSVPSESVPEETKDDSEEIIAQFSKMCNFTLWFISFASTQTDSEKEINDYIQGGSLDETLLELFNSGTIEPSTIKPTIKTLAEKFQSDGKQGLFCLAYTENLTDQRQYYLFEELSEIAYTKKKPAPEKPAEPAPPPDDGEKEQKQAKPTQNNAQQRFKSRAQMNANARDRRVPHMAKGKKKGTESEEEVIF